MDSLDDGLHRAGETLGGQLLSDKLLQIAVPFYARKRRSVALYDPSSFLPGHMLQAMVCGPFADFTGCPPRDAQTLVYRQPPRMWTASTYDLPVINLDPLFTHLLTAGTWLMSCRPLQSRLACKEDAVVSIWDALLVTMSP